MNGVFFFHCQHVQMGRMDQTVQARVNAITVLHAIQSMEHVAALLDIPVPVVKIVSIN